MPIDSHHTQRVDTPHSDTGNALEPVEYFVALHQHLMALHQDLRQRRCERTRGDRWLVSEIARVTERCTRLASEQPQVKPLWEQAQSQIQARFQSEDL